MTTATLYKAGDRVCTVSRDGSRMANCGRMSFAIWTGGIYEAQPRKSDGVLTWRRVGSFGGDRSGQHPSDKFIKELQEAAEYEWRHHVRHGDLVE